MTEIPFPFPVEKLSAHVPHRETAIWIDEVIACSDLGGQCLVYVKDAPYITKSFVRPSGYIEFMAQSYGFSRACHLIHRPNSGQKQITEAFLVGIKDFEIIDPRAICLGETLRVTVEKTRELGDLVLLEGMVFTSSDKCLAKGQLKLFAR